MLMLILILILDLIEYFSYHSKTVDLINVLNFTLKVLIGECLNLLKLLAGIFVIVDSSPIG